MDKEHFTQSFRIWWDTWMIDLRQQGVEESTLTELAKDVKIYEAGFVGGMLMAYKEVRRELRQMPPIPTGEPEL